MQLEVRGRDLRDAVIGLLPTAAALLVASWVLDGLTISPWWWALVVAAVTAGVDTLVRPVLRVLARFVGAVLALLLGLVVQILVVHTALFVTPGVEFDGLYAVGEALLMVALISVVTRWIVGVNDSSYLVADLIRRGRNSGRGAGRNSARGAEVSSSSGVVFVQLDGVPYPALEYGIVSGTLPTLARWVRSGSHDAARWWACVPSTTPASQAALLHGSNEGIPAFRWYEKHSGRLMVANRPADAAEIEKRLSDGRGLLADGGVSVSNMFSGDAPTALVVMSRAAGRNGLGPGGAYVRFFSSPYVFVRALLLTLGEIVKELYQGRQQKLRGIEPRVPRRGSYVALRGLTNALLRDLNVALVAEHMMAGAPSLYVDFVDYDEIAHHAGVARPESLAALAGLDRVLKTLEEVAAAAPREYRFVVLSDHGQSQGATFLQISGHSLEARVRSLVGIAESDTMVETGDVESRGPLNAMLADVLSAAPMTSRLVDGSTSGAGSGPPTTAGTDLADRPELVVVGSGNLGLVWFPQLPGRVPLEDLEERWPALVPGLVSEPAIAFVVVDSARGPLAVGSSGVHILKEGVVEGDDPLRPFGPRAAADLLRVASMDVAPDLYVHSALDARTGDVHAFEELVGSHGGLGGWQNHAVLVHPRDWALDADLLDPAGELVGAETVHRQLIRWLERCGARNLS